VRRGVLALETIQFKGVAVKNAASNSDAQDDRLEFVIRVTPDQYWEICDRMGLQGWFGAFGEYLIGCALDEPRDELLERIRDVQIAEHARFRAEIEAERSRSRK
jgi:hypothetical protein